MNTLKLDPFDWADEYPLVTIQCYWYVVDFGPAAEGQRYHNVGKNKQCTCKAKGDCPAVQAVVRHLSQGGRRAPEPRRDLWLKLPQSCPICHSPVEADHELDSTRHGLGWRCKSEAEHYWWARQKLTPKTNSYLWDGPP